MVEGLLSVSPDEGLHESGLADAGRTDDGNDGRRGLVIWGAVDEGDMETGLVTLSCSTALSVCITAGLGSKCLKNQCEKRVNMGRRRGALFR